MSVALNYRCLHVCELQIDMSVPMSYRCLRVYELQTDMLVNLVNYR